MSITTDTQKELAHLARALKAPRLLAAAERLDPDRSGIELVTRTIV